MNRIESCNFEAGAWPVGEEVVRYDLTLFHRDGPEMEARKHGDYVLFDDHQRLLEEAKQGQRVLAHEVERLKAQRDELRGIAYELFSGADCNTVHHETHEQHGGADECPVINRIRKTIVRIGAKP